MTATAAITLAGCASQGTSDWPGGQTARSPDAASDAVSNSDFGPTAEAAGSTEPAESTSAILAEATLPSQEIAAASTAETGGPTQSPINPASGVVSRSTLKQIFDPELKTRGITPSFDFGESLVTFEFNSANVDANDPTTVAQIEEIGYFFQDPETRGRKFLLIGHTDAAGDDSYNLLLSKERAESIKDLLLSKFPDIYPEIIIDGAGERNLKDPAEGRSRVNRRVELREVR